jgi:8-oxo-dGTP pyrophosphatase MutT (NUDIX family)
MSSFLFSADSLKKHPCFAEDGYAVFSTVVRPALRTQLGEDIDPALEQLWKKREATSRSCLPAHITTSSILLSADLRSALLLFHRKIGEWVYPGGHADGDWHLLRSSLRECFEETALQEVCVHPPRALADDPANYLCPHLIQRFEIRPAGNESAHIHYDAVFVFSAVSEVAAVHDPSEALALKWVELTDLQKHARRGKGVVDGLSALTAQICLQGMQSALGH